MIDSQIREVKFGQRFKVRSKQAGVGIPFVIKYQTKLIKIGQIMKMLEHLLYQDESVKLAFTHRPLVSYHSAKS